MRIFALEPGEFFSVDFFPDMGRGPWRDWEKGGGATKSDAWQI
jgi:hypothetical protein